ncbi:MAG: hypothetical protein AAB631_02525 [Patescibacteria group bacterium]
MVKKLTFFLTQRIAWRLALEAALFGGFLWWSTYDSTEFLFWTLYGAFLLWIYLQEQPERKRTRIMFWFFAILSVGELKALAETFPESASIGWVIVGFTIFFFFLVGITSFFIKQREFVYSLLSTTLFFLVAAWAFSFSGFFALMSALFLFCAVLLLFRGAFGFFDIAGRRRVWIVSAVIAFLALQAGFFLKLLPLGFLNAAAFLTLILFLMRDSVIAHYRGKLDIPFLLRGLAFFVGVAILIFAGSQWSV